MGAKQNKVAKVPELPPQDLEQQKAAEKAQETMIAFFSQKANVKVPYVPEDLRPLLRQEETGVWSADVSGRSHSLYGACRRVRNITKIFSV
jgi:hypothetical protein